MNHAFAISSCVVFVAPMTLITALYVLIGLRLRNSRLLTRRDSGGSAKEQRKAGGKSSQNHVIRMLVAVVVAFFICWAPFHAQRLLAVYGDSKDREPSDIMVTVYYALTYISGILYYLSTTINPVLYNIMSLKFRDAFKGSLRKCCGASRFSFKNKHSELANRQINSWKHVQSTRTYSSSLFSQSERQKSSHWTHGRWGDHSEAKAGQMPMTRLVTVRCANSTKPSDLHSHSYFFHGQEHDTSTRPSLPTGAQKIEMYDVSAEEVVVYLEGEKNPVEVVLLPKSSPTKLYPKAPSPMSSSSEDSPGCNRRVKVPQGEEDDTKKVLENIVADYVPVEKCPKSSADMVRETRGVI